MNVPILVFSREENNYTHLESLTITATVYQDILNDESFEYCTGTLCDVDGNEFNPPDEITIIPVIYVVNPRTVTIEMYSKGVNEIKHTNTLSLSSPVRKLTFRNLYYGIPKITHPDTVFTLESADRSYTRADLLMNMNTRVTYSKYDVIIDDRPRDFIIKEKLDLILNLPVLTIKNEIFILENLHSLSLDQLKYLFTKDLDPEDIMEEAIDQEINDDP